MVDPLWFATFSETEVLTSLPDVLGLIDKFPLLPIKTFANEVGDVPYLKRRHEPLLLAISSCAPGLVVFNPTLEYLSIYNDGVDPLCTISELFPESESNIKFVIDEFNPTLCSGVIVLPLRG